MKIENILDLETPFGTLSESFEAYSKAKEYVDEFEGESDQSLDANKAIMEEASKKYYVVDFGAPEQEGNLQFFDKAINAVNFMLETALDVLASSTSDDMRNDTAKEIVNFMNLLK